MLIVEAMFSGEAPWDKIKEAWNIPKSNYHDMFLNKRQGESGMMIDIGIILVFPTDYAIGMSHIALWDSLDYKINHYLGLDMIQTMIVEIASRNYDFSQLDILSFPIPPYIYLLVPTVISGNFTLISLALMYPLIIISVSAFVVNATVVCMISIVVLGVLAPLFVPMYLFEYTKGYFEAWVKLIISFMLQPMVAIVFMTTKYKYKEMAFSGAQMQMVTLNGTLGTYEPRDNRGGRAIRCYYLNNDWVGSGYTKKKKKACISSQGYILITLLVGCLVRSRIFLQMIVCHKTNDTQLI